jgi:arylsulfatase A-like enzyme
MPHPDRPNVLLIVLDSVRADHTSLHGHCNDTTPFLETFAQDATVYEQARAPSIWSLPSHVSIFTGLDPHDHLMNRRHEVLETGHTVWEQLSEEWDYATGVFTSNPYLTEVPIGLADVFDHVDGGQRVPYPGALTPRKVMADDERGHLGYLKACVRNEKPGKSFLNGLSQFGRNNLPRTIKGRIKPDDNCEVHIQNLQEWIEETDDPWAACLNLMDAHAPYDPSEEANLWDDGSLPAVQSSLEHPVWGFTSGRDPWWKRDALRALYDGTIRQMDAALKRLMSWLELAGEFSETLVVITSDHGEGFGDCSLVRPNVRYTAHGYGIGESLLHVPLLIRRPGQDSSESISRVAALSAFPAVVVDYLEGNHEVSFADDDHVLCSSVCRPRNIESAREYQDDISMIKDDAYALYEATGQHMHKYVKWGTDTCKVSYSNTLRPYPVSVERDVSTPIPSMLEEPPTDLRAGRSSAEISGATEERLKELGYL